MDNLPDHFLLPIAIRVAKSSIRNLFRFRAISLHHWKLLVQPEVLRALPRSCLFYLFDPKPCTEKIAYMQRLSANGHSTFCVALATQLFQNPDLDLEEVRRVLDVATCHGSNGAKYFLMILDVQAEGGFSVGSVFSVFIDLFVDRQLTRCRRSLMNLKVHPDLAFLL